MRQRVIIGVLIALACLLTACRIFQPEPEVRLRRGTVRLGSIDAVVSATGAILPEEQASLSFEQPGIVQEVFVAVGDAVAVGEPLARINAHQLELGVRQAELALRAQQLAYERLFVTPSPAQVAAAQAAVDSAKAAYAQTAQPVDPETLRIAEFEYQRAYNSYEQAKMNYDAVAWLLPEERLVSYREALNQATVNVEVARLRLEQLRAGPDEASLQAAQASIDQAQAELNRLFEGPSDLEVARAQVQIDQAQLALNQAVERFRMATLVAPFAGVVAEVNIQPGAVTPVNRPAVVLVDASRLHVEVNVDELDVARLVVGQPVRVTLDALPGAVVEGQVTQIALSATNDRGVVTYAVRIDLAPTDLPLLIGMTATVEIIVQRLDNVLLAPNWAIRIDRKTNQTFLSILAPDSQTVQEVPVLLGLRGEAESQVVAGVSEGQIVAVNLEPEQLDLFGGGGE